MWAGWLMLSWYNLQVPHVCSVRTYTINKVFKDFYDYVRPEYLRGLTQYTIQRPEMYYFINSNRQVWAECINELARRETRGGQDDM